MNLNDILIVTPFHHREDISELYWINKSNLNARVVAIVSDEENEKLAEKYTDYILRHDNYPIGTKWNAGINYARKLDYTHIMILGSDDIISPPLIDMYSKHDEDAIGLLDAIAMDMGTGMMKYFKGYDNYRSGETVGSGRLIKRKIIEKARYELFDPHNQSLDLTMTIRLNKLGVKVKGIKHYSAPYRLGLKTPYSISGVKGKFKIKPNIEQLTALYGDALTDKMLEYILKEKKKVLY